MKKTENYLDFRLEIENNLTCMSDFIDRKDQYPYLHKRLMAHNGAIYGKLIHLLKYTLECNVWIDLETGQREHVVTDTSKYKGGEWRGWEVRISYEYMTDQWGGDFNSWKHAIKYLSCVGLIYPWYPGHHDATENTPAQMYSIKRAEARSKETGRKRKPITWYGFPRYKGFTLEKAEDRAERLSELSLNGLSEDSVREALGNDAEAAIFARRAFDSLSGGVMFDTTAKRREILLSVCLDQIAEDGYTTREKVFDAAWERYTGVDKESMPDDIFDREAYNAFKAANPTYFDREERRRFLLTWDAYRPTLRREGILDIGRPSNEEMDRWNLTSRKAIIRAVLQTTV